MKRADCHPDRVHEARGSCHTCYSRARYAANPEKGRARRAAYRAANPDKVRAYNAAWKVAHPEERAAQNAKRRHTGSGGSYTTAEWRDKIALHAGCCIYCGRSDRPLTADHNVPLSRGGSNDILNILPSCGPCNYRKGAKTAREYIALQATAL